MAALPICAPEVFTITLADTGQSFKATADEALLHQAERAGFEWGSSCRKGTCRTCICLLTQGRVSYRIEGPGLLAEEKAEGWVLPCVAHAASDITLSMPAV